jgi:hypothetical protein
MALRFAFRASLAVLAAAAAAGSASAHHSSTGSFDLGRTVTVEGVIVKQLWANPHAVLYLDVKTAGGSSERWFLYGYPPQILARLGVTKEMLKAGVSVTAIGNPGRDTEAFARAISSADSDFKAARMIEIGEVRFADGKIASFGRGPAFDGRPLAERLPR